MIIFSKITIALENGKKFTVIVHNSSVTNKYIQQASMEGKELNTPWFTHEQLMNGGTLELEMGPKPNMQRGTEGARINNAVGLWIWKTIIRERCPFAIMGINRVMKGNILKIYL